MQIPKFPVWICALAMCAAVTVHAQDNTAQAAARAALLQKMQELDSTPSVTAPTQSAPASVTIAPVVSAAALPTPPAAPAAQVPVAVATPAPVITATPAATGAVPAGDNAAQAAARTAVQQKLSELGSGSTPESLPAVTAPAASAPAATVAQMGAPALPITMTKEQKLNWLLSLYKSDKLTPQQYHDQRVAILAVP